MIYGLFPYLPLVEFSAADLAITHDSQWMGLPMGLEVSCSLLRALG